MQEEGVGEVFEAVPRFAVRPADRFIGQVGAGHHERRDAHVAEQDRVQRRVREHEPEVPVPGGDRVGDPSVRLPLQQHYGTAHALQQLALCFRNVAERRDLLSARSHQRKGLLLPAFALAEQADGAFVGGIAGQVEPTQSADRQDPVLLQEPCRRLQGITCAQLGFRLQPDVRPADRARVGLGVVTPVGGVLVLM